MSARNSLGKKTRTWVRPVSRTTNVVDSTRRYVARYFWALTAQTRGRLFTAEYRRGPVPVPALGLALTFDELYAGTSVPTILHPIQSDDEEASKIELD